MITPYIGIGSCRHHTPTTTAPPTTSVAEPPSSADTWVRYNIRWIDNGVVDLLSPEATFLRAYAESRTRSLFAPGKGMAAIEAGGYPGFVHAFNNAEPPDWLGGTAGKYVHVGTDYYEIIDLHRVDNQYTAVYCEYESMTAIREHGLYTSWGSKPHSHAEILTFGPDPALPADQQQPPKSRQKGAARAPLDEVFGTWVATPGSTEHRPPDEVIYRCMKLAPGTPTDWPYPTHEHPEYRRPTPPPTLPPFPGWPEHAP